VFLANQIAPSVKSLAGVSMKSLTFLSFSKIVLSLASSFVMYSGIESVSSSFSFFPQISGYRFNNSFSSAQS
tara:strand:+ start:653 stop:868 length:216 start_codon:yes stop_codon:yes gene_type:complete